MNQSKRHGPGVNADDIPGLNVNGDVPASEPVLFGRQAECEILDRLVAGARTGRGGRWWCEASQASARRRCWTTW